jgi:predicted transcriptional regulator
VEDKTLLAEMTADVVASYLSNNEVAVENLPSLISSVHNTFADLMNSQEKPTTVPLIPAVPVKQSLGDDMLTCLEDGMHFKSLKRHLRSHHNLSPEQYREKWGLPADYPMVAPNYSKKRSRLARESGLGRTGEDKV